MFTKKFRFKNLYYLLITSICMHPFYTYASDLFSTTARDSALTEFTALYNDWWLLIFAITFICWAIIKHEKIRPYFLGVWVGTLLGYVILNNLDKVEAVADTMSSWFN